VNPPSSGRRSTVLPGSEDKRTAVVEMFDRIAGEYERVNRVISLGLDRRWRRTTVDSLGLAPGSFVLDLACGTGDISRILAVKGLRVVGVDLSQNMLRHAGRSGVVVRADVSRLPVADAVADGITCGFALRNLVDLPVFFSECERALRPGGRLAAVDAATPTSLPARVGHLMWFGHVVPWLGAAVDSAGPYRYLPESLRRLPPRPRFREALVRAGFSRTEARTQSLGIVTAFLAEAGPAPPAPRQSS